MKQCLFCGFMLLAVTIITAQNRLTTSYNTSNGLPGNNVYETLVDKEGFLWIATENGLCRFDGTNFTVYNTAAGLPENEVPDIDLDSSGTVWGLPFVKTPVYFNRSRGRFENEQTDTLLRQVQPGNIGNIFALQWGGMAVTGQSNRMYVLNNRRVMSYLIPGDINGQIRAVFELRPGRLLILCSINMLVHENGVITRSYPVNISGLSTRSICLFKQKLYIASGNIIYSMNCAGEAPGPLLPEKNFTFNINYFGNTGRHFYVISENGGAYLLNYNTLDITGDGNIYNGTVVKTVTEDGSGNIWLSTQDEGLLRIQARRAGPFDWPAEMNANFSTVACAGGQVLAGNNRGEIVILTPPFGIQRINLAGKEQLAFWVRKIIPFQNGVFVATQGGDFWLRRRPNGLYTYTPAASGLYNAAKTAHRLNDSLLLTGNHAVTAIHNIRTGRLLDTVRKRVTALTAGDGRIYIGSTDGLYEWANGSLEKIGGRQQGVFQYRIASLCATPDGLVWAGLSADSLLVWRRHTVVAAIPLGKNIPGGSCKALYAGRPGVVWLGTDKGLTCIQYQWNGNNFKYVTAWFGRADGLVNEHINDIFIDRDTVYAATPGGVSFLPANLPQVLNTIPVSITNVLAGGISKGVVERLSLPFGQSNVRIEYSGIDLSGYQPRFAYRINNGPWQYTSQYFVELQFVPGSHQVEIAAIMRNGELSAKPAMLLVTMKTPFWKAPWFWFLALAAVLTGAFILMMRNNRIKRRAQQERVEQEKRLMAAEMSRMSAEQKAAEEKLTAEKKLAELEMQALRAQINPHFVFNCLNSIKGFIHDHDFEQADRYLDAFSQLLRNTLENSVNGMVTLQQEAGYLENYLWLEQLRFGNLFVYAVDTAGIPQPAKTFIPSMLLQPYVENAIRHGVRHLENKQGFIGVTFRLNGLFMECTIEDNGVGRERSARLKSALHIEYQGRGMQISQRRAQLYGATVTVTDRMDGGGQPAGTTVVISTPLQKL